MQPGVEYRDIHLLAAEVMAQGLIDLGILRGDTADLAGYESGRTRSPRFGLGYLRLDRPLRCGMVVTI
jgi:Xaa-Pro aminopeptidase